MNKQVKKLKLIFAVAVFISLTTVSLAQDWKEVGGDHFLVYFSEDEDFAEKVLDRSEVYYKRIAEDLGYPRYSQFWLWDDRTKIYIYPDQASFLKATGQPNWSAGMADYIKKSISSYRQSSDFLDSLLPHEMAHLIFRDFVGFKGEIPLWLDEGVAQWAEEKKRKYISSVVRDFYAKDKLLSIEDLMKFDVRNFREKDRILIRPITTRSGAPGVLFLDLNAFVDTYYLQSVSVVGFLIERYGSSRFSHFCRQLRDGKSLEEAFKFAYPVHVRSLKELENNWREYLEEQLKN